MGYNELSFEDTDGEEQIRVHAQRDLDETVLRDHTEATGRDARRSVRRDAFDRVDQDRTEHTGRHRTTTVDGDEALTVVGPSRTRVGGDAEVHVAGAAQTHIEGRARHTAANRSDLTFEDDVTVKAEGSYVIVVGRDDAKRSFVVHVDGVSVLTSTQRTEVSSTTELVLRCGESVLRLSPAGIELSGPSVTTRSGGTSVGVTSDGAVMKGPGGSGVKLGAGSVGLTSSGASLQLDGAATITGASIALTSPSAAGAGDDKDKAEVTTIELVDEQGHPVPSRPVVLRLDDGTERGAVVGPDGTVAIHDLSSDGTLVVVDAAGQGESTKPELVPHVVKQGEYLTQLAAALGFDRDAIWNDAKNAEVKALRPDPDVLAPGDVVYLPGGKPKGKPLSKGTHNRFVVEAATIEVVVRLQDHEGKPLANVPCEVEGLASYGGAEVPTTTDGDGTLTLRVPTWLRTVSVHLPRSNTTYLLSIGTQDPIEELSGVRKRLQNLGYLPPRAEVTDGEELEMALALRQFQADHDLPTTGEIDEATRVALVEEHSL